MPKLEKREKSSFPVGMRVKFSTNDYWERIALHLDMSKTAVFEMLVQECATQLGLIDTNHTAEGFTRGRMESYLPDNRLKPSINIALESIAQRLDLSKTVALETIIREKAGNLNLLIIDEPEIGITPATIQYFEKMIKANPSAAGQLVQVLSRYSAEEHTMESLQSAKSVEAQGEVNAPQNIEKQQE